MKRCLRLQVITVTFKILEEHIIREKTKLSSLYRINSVTVIKRNLLKGTGVAILPKIAVQEEIAQGLLVKLPNEITFSSCSDDSS